MTAEKEIKYGLYKRKSTDDERQVLSLGSQKSEAIKRFPNLKIIDLPDESVSAFKPYKRPVFNEMIEKIKKGEIQGIVAWHPDRLSRNPIDAAQIIYLLDVGALKDLKFSSYHFDNSPEGKMMLQITMSQSKYSSDKLSKDVKRGMNDKANETGWRPGRTPLGYLNSKKEEKGKQYVLNDQERVDLVKQLLRTMLTGNYTGPQLLKYANEELGLRMPATKKLPSRKLRMSGLYRLLTNPFYYGWFEWPKGSGNWVKGEHEAMITEEEFDHIQFLLGRKGRPRPKKHKFAYTGLMRCGHCGAMITAEEKFKKQKNGNIHHYIYYRCTRRVDPRCTERAIEAKELNKQIDSVLGQINISQRFRDWALKYLHETRTQEAETREQAIKAKHKEYEKIAKQLDNMLLTFISSDNTNEEIMSKDQFTHLKGELMKQKSKLEEDLGSYGKEINQWFEFTEKTFTFVRYAPTWFTNGDIDTKRAIFACLGSDLILKDQKVAINMRKPFGIIFEGLPRAEKELERLEPLIKPVNTRQSETFSKKFPTLSG
ncbi:MAG: hypothetical protein A3J46_00200 [Candidatus Yanofskybacteria bacterium RIFCSPHIGHO2_02_FULL_41_11]|uniref:Recombinase domain-containing protein n=1 Tax=Candidatus Yanofskybacteria bacterium RIFCSPHIGHO2_02_FULL_41_11 TaxID=1802675 RepID=A0A1F8F7A1_9BACT|nr:MAG: hypothetical protein UW86_C0007G0006 [Microgenomates group bacterium GW2011_GWA1_Microgenomates_45_10]OGN09027.1 MAG: hypothetical protein A3J46_00200 [Candidatus Yanofskybacteria bacterium RIFCSPHIGHO2_02_FULL_41_11]